MSDAGHPIWSIIRLAVVNGSVLFAIWLNTATWDTEFWMVAGVLGATTAYEVTQKRVTNNLNRGKEDQLRSQRSFHRERCNQYSVAIRRHCSPEVVSLIAAEIDQYERDHSQSLGERMLEESKPLKG